jgi:hypothetical protein
MHRTVRATVCAIVCAGALLAPAGALAHAHLDRSAPAAGKTLTEAPKEVVLWFTEALEPKFSTIEVRDAKGAAMQAGPAAGVPGNTAQLRVPLKPLRPGTYTVKWRVLSVDTHRSQGAFTFRVGP